MLQRHPATATFPGVEGARHGPNSMRILIAHSSLATQSILRERIRAADQSFACVSASSLTETYNYVEHNDPDCVLIAGALARYAEFELLASLFKMMKTGCVIVSAQPPQPTGGFSGQNFFHIPEDASAPSLVQTIKKAAEAAKRNKLFTRDPATPLQDKYDPRKVLLIGASTGGVDALCQVISHFSANCPPTMIVQHTGGRYARSLIRLLDGATDAKVREGQDGQTPSMGDIYLAPDDTAHLVLSTSGRLRIKLQNESLISGHRPSIDALFHSAVGYAPQVTAALLTGMGRDGAQGLLALRLAGARTFGQDEATSIVYGMPKMAMQMGAVAQQLPIQDIGPAMLRACHVKARA